VLEKELPVAATLRSEVIEALETQLEKAEQTIRDQKNEINNLKSNVDVLVGQIRKLAGNRTQFERTTEAKTGDEPSTAADQATVPPDVFERIANELIPIIGPLATTVVQHDVAALGESIEIFPRKRLPELLDVLTKEILDEGLKHTFRKRFVDNVQFLDR